jgi:lysozyme
VEALDIAVDQLKVDEGLRLKPYRCTEGKLTIGYGRNLEDVGITEAEAGAMLAHDARIALRDAQELLGPCWDSLSPNRQAVMINMAFNLGRTRLSKFTKTLQAVRAAEYSTAAYEMLDSRWARQVGARAARLADLMYHG